MLEWLKRYLGLEDAYKELREAAQLSEDEARAIAEKESGQNNLSFAELSHHNDILIWTFRTPSVGSWLVVRVNDATGGIVGIERQGKR
jgi:uncharacterized membrane protein YkoI